VTPDGSTAGSATPGEDADPDERSRPSWLRPLVVVVIVVVCGWLASTFLGAIDWSAVGEALGRLTAWQVLVLLAVLLVRQTLNALPLALFIDGLGARRALLNDLVASLMAVVAPPPGDLVVRVAMFREWGIEASRGLAGASMNMVAFYVNRFAAPLIGVSVLAVLGSGTPPVAGAMVSISIAVALTVVVSLAVRREQFAARLGRTAANIVRRVRSSVDPEAWVRSSTGFQQHIVADYRRAFPGSLLALSAMVLSDACILLLAIRFVGVPAVAVPAYEVIGIFFLAYPLTLPPMMGLGIYDVVLLGAFMEVGGDALEPELVAALTVWRAVTILGPVGLGGVVALVWRRRLGEAPAGTP
jgi:putative heme transporter